MSKSLGQNPLDHEYSRLIAKMSLGCKLIGSNLRRHEINYVGTKVKMVKSEIRRKIASNVELKVVAPLIPTNNLCINSVPVSQPFWNH